LVLSNSRATSSPSSGCSFHLPDGFEFKEAEMGNTVYCRVGAGERLEFELKNTYAQSNAFDWSN
jgi:hypothetical protein